MRPATTKAIVVALRAVADALEADSAGESVSAATQSGARYYTRKSWIQTGGEGRVFDRAIEEIRSFRAGRRRTVLCDELHAWIESRVEQRTPKERPKPTVAPLEVSNVDRELGRMGESPRSADEIEMDTFLAGVGFEARSAAEIISNRRTREAKAARDADPEIARRTAEETLRADARRQGKHKYPFVPCSRCAREVPQRVSWRKERGVRVNSPTGQPVQHHCPHRFSSGCYNAQGNSEDDGTIQCPWCVAGRENRK